MNDYDPIAATHAILSKLEETSANSELLRRVDDAAVAAMRDAGLARLLAPKQFGGHELPLSMHIRTGIIAAGGCSAAAWVHMVWGAHTFVLGRFSKACQEEVFGASPDVLLPGTLAPQGSVEAMAGGWRLNGRWQFASGVDHGPWLLLGAAGEKDGSGRRAAPRHVVVPKSDMVVDDTWHTLGMRGTGSSDIVAHDVFVPEYRSMPTIPLFMGTFEGDAGALYRLPVMGGLASMLAGVVLGMAETSLAEFIDATKIRHDVYAGGGKAAKAGIQMRVAEASGEIALARMLIERNCALLDAAMIDNPPPLPLDERVQIRWNAAYAVELCRRATERVFSVAGAHAIYNKSMLQKHHRDINTACHHAIADFDAMAEIKGRVHLGLHEGLGLV